MGGSEAMMQAVQPSMQRGSDQQALCVAGSGQHTALCQRCVASCKQCGQCLRSAAAARLVQHKVRHRGLTRVALYLGPVVPRDAEAAEPAAEGGARQGGQVSKPPRAAYCRAAPAHTFGGPSTPRDAAKCICYHSAATQAQPEKTKSNQSSALYTFLSCITSSATHHP